MKNYMKYLLPLLFLPLVACNNDDNQSVADEAERWEVMVLFPEGGLGDQGYNDNTLRGMEEAAQERSDLSLTYFTPDKDGDVGEFFRVLLLQKLDKGSHLLLVLAGSEYGDLARSLMADTMRYPDLDRKIVLLFESDEMEEAVYTFRILFDQASYQLGQLAASLTTQAAILLGNSTDPIIREAAQGFANGFKDMGGEAPEIHALADTPSGFAMPAEAYSYAVKWAATHVDAQTFIYPLAGGSNQGIYRYTRENESRLWAAGVDVDQSRFSKDIIASVVKHTDRIVKQFLVDWRDGKELPKHSTYDVESGMIELVTNKTNNK